MLDPSVWSGTEIAAWDNLTRVATEMTELAATGRTILFRGQPHEWQLRSSLLRALPQNVDTATALRVEQNAADHFRSQAHLYEPELKVESLKGFYWFTHWWSRMQHHGAPTRLLDWTASPYVAAYFAVEQRPDNNGVVLVIDADRLKEVYRPPEPHSEWNVDHFGTGAPEALIPFTPYHKTTRLVAQQGYFTVATRVLDVHDDLLHRAGAILRRWVIPADRKSNILYHLRTMNVGAHSLFPGMDGLGRATGELVRIAR